MPCYRPKPSTASPRPGSTKLTIRFRHLLPKSSVPEGSFLIPIPCGQCIGCRLERSRQWAIRLVKESRLHERNSFLTLTYDDTHLPRLPSGKPTLVLEDIQKFLKKLRKHFEPARLRFFQCGEYGEQYGRPHHHMILFGEDFFKDRFPIENSPSGFPTWQSDTLTNIWGKGRCTINEFSFEDAAYVARYCLKKWSGSGSSLHYQGRKPEFVTMSRNPGIAAGFFHDYFSDIYPGDEVALPGRGVFLPPKYFDTLLERRDPELFRRIKDARKKDVDFWTDKDSTDTRLATRERVKQALIKNCLKRKI